MRCPQCHQEIDPYHQFCPSCGRRLGQTQNAAASSTEAPSVDDMTGVGWQPSLSSFSQQPAVGTRRNENAPSFGGIPYKSSENALAASTLQGIVRHFQQRTETTIRRRQLTIWTFRLERYDQRGNPLPPIPVQMRARRFEGSVNDGDKVTLKGSWSVGQTIDTKRVYNVSIDSAVTAHMTDKIHPIVLGGLVTFAAILIVLFIVIALSSIHLITSFPVLPGISASPDQTMQDFCQNLQSDGYTKAYDDYSSNLQKQVSFQQFTRTWTNGTQYYHFDNCAAQAATINGNHATTTLNTHEFYSGKAQSYAVTLIKEGNAWKIQTIHAQ
jgi:hypothetical protein